VSVRPTQEPLHSKRFGAIFECLNAAVQETCSERRDRLYVLSFLAGALLVSGREDERWGERGSDQADCHPPPTFIQGVLYSLGFDEEL
jgi:hypothetical protein